MNFKTYYHDNKNKFCPRKTDSTHKKSFFKGFYISRQTHICWRNGSGYYYFYVKIVDEHHQQQMGVNPTNTIGEKQWANITLKWAKIYGRRIQTHTLGKTNFPNRKWSEKWLIDQKSVELGQKWGSKSSTDQSNFWIRWKFFMW